MKKMSIKKREKIDIQKIRMRKEYIYTSLKKLK
jgi:hypothetical protein